LGPPEPPRAPAFTFDEQLQVLAEERVPAFSWTFGIPPAGALERMRRAGAVLIGTATTVREARLQADAGVDAVVAQGSEAGGHRGSFAVEGALVGTMALVPQVVDAVRIPVLAAGGIADGRGVAAALALGAEAAVLGTAFLACDEAGTDEAFRGALEASGDEGTTLTRAFSGRWARGLRTRFADELAGGPIADFPLQNALTAPLRRAAGEAGDPEALSRWAGQASALARRGPAARLLERIAAELDETRARMCR
jgi:nitronate monooxygenase